MTSGQFASTLDFLAMKGIMIWDGLMNIVALNQSN